MSVREGNGNPIQYSCLENPVDSGAWWAAVYGVAQSRTRLKWLSMQACIGEGNGNPLQCSCLENPRDRGAWWAAVYGVAQSRPWLKRLSSSSSSGDQCKWQKTCMHDSPLSSFHLLYHLLYQKATLLSSHKHWRKGNLLKQFYIDLHWVTIVIIWDILRFIMNLELSKQKLSTSVCIYM